MGKVIMVIALLLLLGSPVWALNETNPAKAGIFYDFDDSEVLEVVGMTVVENAFGITNLDIDTLMGSQKGETFDDDNKVALGGLSYNYDLNDNVSAGLGLAIGIERFESFKNGETGEAKAGVYAIVGGKF